MAVDQPRKAGRPSLLTDDVQERLITAVRSGSYLDDAAAYAGIGPRTLFRWMDKGRTAEEQQDNGEPIDPSDERYLQFWQALRKARADATLRNIGIIQTAAQEGTWQAAAWYLERTNPKKWGRYETVDIEGVERGDVRQGSEIADLLDERIARMRERSRVVIEAVGMPALPEAKDEDEGPLSIAQ